MATSPYNPKNMAVPNYVANDRSVFELLAVFFSTVGFALLCVWFGTRSLVNKLDRLKICWFVICGALHIILEGYFAFYAKVIAGGNNYLDQMWKEFAKGDSRYVINDTAAVCVEGLTAVAVGPLCLLAAIAFLRQSSFRYVLQMIVSVSQLYGTIIYFSTEAKDEFIHGALWHPLYFWFYFVFLNSLWIVIPFTLIVQASRKIAAAQSSFDYRTTKKD